MLAKLNSPRCRYILFFLLAFMINITSGSVTRCIGNSECRLLTAIGASFNVVVIVTSLYYWLLVRPGIRAGVSVIPVAVAGMLHAMYICPISTTQRNALVGLCEVALIGFAVQRIRRGVGGSRADIPDADPVETIRKVLTSLFMIRPVAAMFSIECAILYYAFFSWRAKPHVSCGAKAFGAYKRLAQPDMLIGLVVVIVAEILPFHILLNRWSPVCAWIATGLTAYGVIWLIGISRSIDLRPVLVGSDYLDLRYGLLFRLRIPRVMIRSVHRMNHRTPSGGGRQAARTRLCIELASPMDAERLFGLRRRVSYVLFVPDELEPFETALEEMMRNGL